MDSDKKILITGATGFVGSYLVRHLLEKGYKNIFALRRATSPMDLVADISDKVQWVEGDILDVPFLMDLMTENGIERIFHCAAVVSFDPRDREEMYKINVEGTANIINVALDSSVEKLVHMSSIAAIGRVKNEFIVSENNKWQRSPYNTHYAISKYQAEQEVWRGAAEGLTVAIVNPSVILGAQFWQHGTGRLFQQVWEGLRFYTEGSTGYVDVRDVVRFMTLLMASSIDNQRFILNGENWAYRKMFDNIAQVLQKPTPSVKVSPFLSEIAWRIEWFKSLFTRKKPLITRETAKIANLAYQFMNEKSLKFFPEFHYTPIEKTITETGQVFLESKKNNAKAGILR